MDGRVLLSELINRKSVNDLVHSFNLLTQTINDLFVEDLKKKTDSSGGEQAGASELTKLLSNIIVPLCADASDKELHDYLVRTHIVFIYFDTQLSLLQNELNNDDAAIEEQIKQIAQQHACVAATRSMFLDAIAKRSFGQSNLANQTRILTPIETHFDDFSLLMQQSTPGHKKKICALSICEVADKSRCITFTEMLPLSQLPQVVEKFYPDKLQRNHFKQKLCNHMINNVGNITKAQRKRAEPSQKPDVDQNKIKQHTIFTILKTIKEMILDTQWTVGLLGGVKIHDQHGHLINTVPHGMAKIIAIIDSVINNTVSNIANHPLDLFDKLNQVGSSSLKSAKHHGLSFFSLGKRDNKTQKKYEDIYGYISSNIAKLKMI